MDGRDNWGKKWILCIILTSCSGWGYWYLLKEPDHSGHILLLHLLLHTDRSLLLLSGSQQAANCRLCFHQCQAHFGNYDLQGFGGEWTEMGTSLCNLPKAWLMVGAVIEEGGKTL